MAHSSILAIEDFSPSWSHLVNKLLFSINCLIDSVVCTKSSQGWIVSPFFPNDLVLFRSSPLLFQNYTYVCSLIFTPILQRKTQLNITRTRWLYVGSKTTYSSKIGRLAYVQIEPFHSFEAVSHISTPLVIKSVSLSRSIRMCIQLCQENSFNVWIVSPRISDHSQYTVCWRMCYLRQVSTTTNNSNIVFAYRETRWNSNMFSFISILLHSHPRVQRPVIQTFNLRKPILFPFPVSFSTLSTEQSSYKCVTVHPCKHSIHVDLFPVPIFLPYSTFLFCLMYTILPWPHSIHVGPFPDLYSVLLLFPPLPCIQHSSCPHSIHVGLFRFPFPFYITPSLPREQHPAMTAFHPGLLPVSFSVILHIPPKHSVHFFLSLSSISSYQYDLFAAVFFSWTFLSTVSI